MTAWIRCSALVVTVVSLVPLQSTPVPTHVDMTWMSIANMYYEIGSLKIITDGYFSRVPQSEFYGGGGGQMDKWRLDRSGMQPVANSEVKRAIGFSDVAATLR